MAFAYSGPSPSAGLLLLCPCSLAGWRCHWFSELPHSVFRGGTCVCRGAAITRPAVRSELQPLGDRPSGGTPLHSDDQPPPNGCVRVPFTSEKPRTSAPATRLFHRASEVCPSSHGAISNQAPRMTFSQRNGRAISQSAMIARLATMGPMIRSFARAGSA